MFLKFQKSLTLLIVIAGKGKGDEILNFLVKQGKESNFLTTGKGTANKVSLSPLASLAYLGFGDNEKDIVYSIISDGVKPVLKKLERHFTLNKSGTGIAFTIPINSIFSPKTKQKDLFFSVKGESKMQLFDHQLIIAITNHGYADEVMDIAKSVGASGGTILEGRGVALKEAEKFFGTTIQSEKEILFILTKKSITNEIMDALSTFTESRAFIFSLPVNNVIGLMDRNK